MSILSSLFSGISGLVAHGSALSVVGDNIANVNTIGFKRGSAQFESMLTQRIGNSEVGLGTRLSSVSTNFAQGNFESTANVTDLAIDGAGFFVVANDDGQFYTRAGNFVLDRTGQIVNPRGYVLQGYEIDPNTLLPNGAPGDIVISNQTSPPVQTTRTVFNLNLDAGESVPGAAFDGSSFENAASSSNFSRSFTAYDSLGNPRSVVVYFRKSAVNTWTYHALTDITNLTNAATPTDGTVIIGQGMLTFDTDGNLTQVDVTAGAVAPGATHTPGQYVSEIRWSGATAVNTQDTDTTWDTDEFVLDFGRRLTATGPNVYSETNGETTQFGLDSEASSIEANGRRAGSIQSFSVNADGFVQGAFDNGDTRALYRIAIATFPSEQNLDRLGGNLYAETIDSGLNNINFANTGGRGQVQGSTLELSNVDLAAEFVKMVVNQRGFQANARTISTTDDLLAELVNLGR